MQVFQLAGWCNHDHINVHYEAHFLIDLKTHMSNSKFAQRNSRIVVKQLFMGCSCILF